MALKSTVFKLDLQIADMDRAHYQPYALTVARHPSENDRRMLLRILAFALHADEQLAFTRGISTDDEPDLWQRSLDGRIERWIELGQPDEKRLRRACGLADEVIVYSYQDRSGQVWWQQREGDFARFANLRVRHLPDEQTQDIEALAERNMQLQCNVQDGEVWFGNTARTWHIVPQDWKLPA